VGGDVVDAEVCTKSIELNLIIYILYMYTWDETSNANESCCRYSTNNAYIGFKRMVHDAQYPGDDIPPLPHPSTWFSHLEDPKASSTSRDTTTSSHRSSPARRTRARNNRNRSASPAAAAAGGGSDDDIAIARERISLRCPLTLQPFKDPVTSTKCPHSFERQAIEDMISRSQHTVPVRDPSGGNKPRRVRAVECPVCSVMLTLHDLRSDPVLLRRVRRAEAARRREEDEDDDDEFDPDPEAAAARRRLKGSRQSGFTVASDDDEEDDDDDAVDVDRVPVKQER